MLNMNSTNPPVLCFSADVLGRSVNEPLEPGGAGEEGSGEFPYPLATDYQKDQRGENRKVKGYGEREHIFLQFKH